LLRDIERRTGVRSDPQSACSLVDVDDEARRTEARKRFRELIAKLPPDEEAFRRIEEHTAHWYGPLSPETLARIKQHVAQRSTQSQE
jgi:hypothetical protein